MSAFYIYLLLATIDEPKVTVVSLPPSPPVEEELLIKRKLTKQERRKKKAQLRSLMKKVAKPKRVRKATKLKKVLDDTDSIRTKYELVFESYLKLLGQPYLINQVFCFTCGNFYHYGEQQSCPKKCQVCQINFYRTGRKFDDDSGHLSRPDFILDFNNDEARLQYRKDVQYHRLDNIKLYQSEYLKKIGVVRIDGSIHDKKRQKIKDYWQYMSFKEKGVKVFIIQNDDIDRMLADNGKELLEHCHLIGNCCIDEADYLKYCQNKDFLERVNKPF